ncbi:MAG: hypothetical protein LWW86_10440 [Micrococcales bacterium]|nr:hypothetical protein [Micrococcales bacterium]
MENTTTMTKATTIALSACALGQPRLATGLGWEPLTAASRPRVEHGTAVTPIVTGTGLPTAGYAADASDHAFAPKSAVVATSRLGAAV